MYVSMCVCVCVSGARAVYGMDQVSDRLELARRMGASRVIHTGKVSGIRVSCVSISLGDLKIVI